MGDEKVEVQFTLRAGEREIEASASVPKGASRPVELLPIFLGIASALVEASADQARESGKAISCKAGCGACCRQFVPVSENEAWFIAALVNSMPEERRERVLRRFADAIARIERAGLGDEMRNAQQYLEKRREQVGLLYFHLGIECPFLEEESCSIHPYRPAVCREYLVTSDPKFCSGPNARDVQRVDLFGRPSIALFEMDTNQIRFMSLLYALEFAQANEPPLPVNSGPEILREFLRRLSGVLRKPAVGPLPPIEPSAPTPHGT